MSGVTSAGLPYPGPQDALADTGKFIRDLDDAITFRLGNTGFATQTVRVTTNASGDVNLLFNTLAWVQGAVVQYVATPPDVWVIYPIIMAVTGVQVTVRLIYVEAGAGYQTHPFVGGTDLTAMAWGTPK